MTNNIENAAIQLLDKCTGLKDGISGKESQWFLTINCNSTDMTPLQWRQHNTQTTAQRDEQLCAHILTVMPAICCCGVVYTR